MVKVFPGPTSASPHSSPLASMAMFPLVAALPMMLALLGSVRSVRLVTALPLKTETPVNELTVAIARRLTPLAVPVTTTFRCRRAWPLRVIVRARGHPVAVARSVPEALGLRAAPSV